MADAADLVEHLRDMVTGARAERSHTPLVQQRFDDAIAALDVLDERLLSLQELVVLTDTSSDDLDMGAANSVWDGLPVDADVRDLAVLVGASPTLSTLHRAGIDVRSVRRYGDVSVKAAAAIGGRCGKYPQYSRLLLPPPAGRPREASESFLVKREAADDVAAMLRELSALKVISGFTLKGLRVLRGKVDPAFESFLRGHWLTAYAYAIALDQFSRAGRPFEIYSNLEYALPGEMGGGRSDIDVLVRTADQVMMIECKSGRVLQSRHNGTPIDKVIHNATKLDEVLTTMGVDLRRNYLLVHVGHETDQEIAKALDDKQGGITSPIEPAGLRAHVSRLITPE